MKIKINYDFMDRISEANKGFSLKRAARRALFCAAVASTINTVDYLASGSDLRRLPLLYSFNLLFNSGYTAMYTKVFSPTTKLFAEEDLVKLLSMLRSIHVRTDYESLLQSYSYKKEYKINKDKKLPSIIQKNYIKIPVHDEYFGDREISVVQEHVIGTRNYDISCGEPEEKKVYSLKMRPVTQQ